MRVVAAMVLVVVWLLAGPAAAEKRVAFVLGIADYAHAPRLANTINDARAVAAALRRLGFEVIDGEDLDREATTRALRRFAAVLDGAELGLFYFAGHGLQVGGVNYLVPVDARLADEADLLFEAVELDTVLRLLEQRTRVGLVFLDSCRDNPLAANLARSMGTRSQAVGRGLASVAGGIGTLIAYATQPDNVALDGSGRHSPFTEAVLEYLETPGLEVRQMLSRVRQRVIETTGGRQVPWDHSSLTGDVYLAAAPAAAAPTAPPAIVPPDPASAELLYWQSVQAGDDPADLQAYLERFPDGTFAELARNRIARLQPGRAALPPAEPAPPPEVDPLAGRYVALANANVRARPTTDSERIDYLPQDTPVTVLGRVRGADWLQVEIGGGYGFVHASLLGPPRQVAQPPPEAVPEPVTPPSSESEPRQVAAVPPAVPPAMPSPIDVTALVRRAAEIADGASYVAGGDLEPCRGEREFRSWEPQPPADSRFALAAPGFGGPAPDEARTAQSRRARGELAVFHGPDGLVAVEHTKLQALTRQHSAWCPQAASSMRNHWRVLRERWSDAGSGGSFLRGRFQVHYVPVRLAGEEPRACAAFTAAIGTDRLAGYACRRGEGMMSESELRAILDRLTIRHVLG
jgi:hypothetical protein